jgi:hypothetical protein
LKYLSSLILFVLLCSPSWGATQLKKTVCPSGCDYTSLESCMNANEQNLVTADKYFDVEISGTWSSADTTAITVHNYTTDATRYINIYTTGSARHQGVFSTSKYYLTGRITVANQYVTINGLQSSYTIGGNYAGAFYFSTGSGNNTIAFNIIRFTGNYSLSGGLYIDAGTNHFVINNIIYATTNGHSNCVYGGFTSGSYFYGNTFFNAGKGMQSGSLAKNNIAYNNTTDFAGTYNAASTNNLSKDATAPAYGTYYRNKTLTFTNTSSTTEDLHLISTDTDAIDKGADLSGTFTTDIDGTTRTGTWDIGADEYVSAVTPTYGSVLSGVYGSFYYKVN